MGVIPTSSNPSLLSSNQVIVISMTILHLAALSTSMSTLDCPAVCQSITCKTGILYCPHGGLQYIPYILPPNIKRVILTNHRFLYPVLSYINFTNFPRASIDKITILNCSISEIQPGAFSHLYSIPNLDLANNRIREIKPYTFKDMHITFLRLDNNRGIHLRENSFSGLKLKGLSLVGCQLNTLNYSSLHDLVLERLILTQNNLRVIDMRFSEMFRGLRELELNDNPLDCSCDMKWLTQVLAFRKGQLDRESHNYASDDGGGGSDSSKTPYVTQVRCVSPARVVNRLVYELVAEDDFICGLPKLTAIDVEILGSTAILLCHSNLNGFVEWRSPAGHILGEPGVNRSQVTIYRTVPQDPYVPREYQQQESLKTQSQLSSVYLCVTRNSNGNTSAEIHLKWPSIPPIDHSTKFTSSSSTGDIDNQIDPSSSSSTTTQKLFIRQFTVLEMIGSVVGTFVVTLFCSLLIYRGIIIPQQHSHHSLQQKRKHYETVGDSLTYDVPSTTPPCYQQMFASSPASIPSSQHSHNYHQYHPHHPPALIPNNNCSSLNNNNNNCSTLSNSVITPSRYLDFKNPPQIIDNPHLFNYPKHKSEL